MHTHHVLHHIIIVTVLAIAGSVIAARSPLNHPVNPSQPRPVARPISGVGR